MFFYKKIFAIIISFLYIFANYIFYNAVFHEQTNDRLFQIASFLFATELIFWIVLFFSTFYLKREGDDDEGNKGISIIRLRKDFLVSYSIFLISLICVNISRIILQSSPYINDLVSRVDLYVWLIGGTRVLFIFSSIMFIFCASSMKNAFLITISVLNFFVSILIWLEFDGNISAILRIGIAGIAVIYYLLLRNDVKNNGKTENLKVQLKQNKN